LDFYKKAAMKIPLNSYPGFALLFLLFSCNNGSSDSVKNAKEANTAKIDSQIAIRRPGSLLTALPQKADADFLVNAASEEMLTVQLGQVAQANSRNQQVKNFRAMMVRDHGESGEKLKKLAAVKNVALPGAIANDQQKEKEKLQEKKGNEFDIAYINRMVNEYKRDIRDFRKEIEYAVDTDIRAFVSSHLIMLHRHPDAAKQLQKAMKKIDDNTGMMPPVP
jgi:putative membrane protein